MRILLVGSSSTDQIALQHFFQPENIQAVDSLPQALESLKIPCYDLILLDLDSGENIPLELLEHAPETPIIIMAARGGEAMVIKALKAGASDFLIKDGDYLSLLPSMIDKVMKFKVAEERLNHYRSELKRSDEELKNFVFVASHDLNEPLRKVVGFGDRLLDKVKDLNPDAKVYAEKMQDSAKRMQGMIEDLLQYSRVSVQGASFRPIDLNKVVKNVLRDLETSINETKGVVLVKDLPTVEADPAQMRQLFRNLISNAIKFQKKEETPKVELIAKPVRKDSWDIHVSDNGIGLKEKHKDNIFQPFFKLHGRSAFEGSGIGLAICKKIVVRHNGEIEMSCSGEKGSTFKVNLPSKQLL